MKTYGFVLTLF